jgi:hypothetical protein
MATLRDGKLSDKKRRAVGDRGLTGSGFGSPFTQIVYTEIKSLSLVRQRAIAGHKLLCMVRDGWIINSLLRSLLVL